MKFFKNPHWWTVEDDCAWENAKAGFKLFNGNESQCAGAQRNRRVHEGDGAFVAAVRVNIIPLSGEPPYDVECAYRFGYGAQAHYGRKYPKWNSDVEKHARADWMELYASRVVNWGADLKAIREGWHYGKTRQLNLRSLSTLTKTGTPCAD